MFTEWLQKTIEENWNNRLLGEIFDINIKVINQGKFIAKESFNTPVSILIANIAAASSTIGTKGTAGIDNLKEIKTKLDITAGKIFADVLSESGSFSYIASSEAKDEFGDNVDDPLKSLVNINDSNYGIAVDVVDGTTLAAKGIDGAYSISAATGGLKTFPDMQAYTIGGPIEVLESFNFALSPEDAVRDFIADLCKYYNKSPEDLRIVTHSSDKGHVHDTLIRKIRESGAAAIIPEPVIVEPPYALSMALHNEEAPHAMIGVFGLPEIVINTLLLSTIDTDCELAFKIGSNSLLHDHNHNRLDNAFNFTTEEKKILNEMDLSTNKVYNKNSVAENLDNACFAATAITNDNLLGLKGVDKKNGVINTESLFSGYHGNLVKLTIKHRI